MSHFGSDHIMFRQIAKKSRSNALFTFLLKNAVNEEAANEFILPFSAFEEEFGKDWKENLQLFFPAHVVAVRSKNKTSYLNYVKQVDLKYDFEIVSFSFADVIYDGIRKIKSKYAEDYSRVVLLPHLYSYLFYELVNDKGLNFLISTNDLRESLELTETYPTFSDVKRFILPKIKQDFVTYLGLDIKWLYGKKDWNSITFLVTSSKES